MRRKTILTVSVATLAAGIIAVLLWAHRALTPSAPQTPPVTLRYIKERNPDGSLSAQPTFWVTNHTDKALAVSLTAIEVQVGSAWNTNMILGSGGLLFSQTANKPANLIGPHEADEGTLDATRLVLPQTGRWRVRAHASERLTSVSKLKAGLKLEWDLVEARHLTGNTNIPVPLNFLSKDISYYGRSREVVSEEVLLESAPEKSVCKPLATRPAAALQRADPEEIVKLREALRQQIQATGQPRASTPP
jgi:hypothetical protein